MLRNWEKIKADICGKKKKKLRQAGGTYKTIPRFI